VYIGCRISSLALVEFAAFERFVERHPDFPRRRHRRRIVGRRGAAATARGPYQHLVHIEFAIVRSATTCTGESDSKRILVETSALPLSGVKWKAAVRGTGFSST
jgi:hypothetical protein